MLSERSKSQKAIVDDSIYMKCLEQANKQKQRVDQWLPKAGKFGKNWD